MNFSFAGVKAMLDPFFYSYTCKDGRLYYLVATAHQKHQRTALEVLGLWEEMQQRGIPQGDLYRPASEWPKGVHTLLGTFPLTDPHWIELLKDPEHTLTLTLTLTPAPINAGENGGRLSDQDR